MRLVLQNFILFQAGWFACVLGGASAYSWAGSVVVLVIIAIHLLCAKKPSLELKLIVFTAIIGAVFDSLLTATGLLQFQNGLFIDGLAPHWMIAMWALFATTLNVSLRWIKGKVVLSALLGLIGGPLAYYAGNNLGAVEFTSPALALTAVGIGWALIMPILSLLASKNDGYLLDREAPLKKQGVPA